MIKKYFFVLWIVFPGLALAMRNQDKPGIKEMAHEYCRQNGRAILQEFTSLLAIPNVAADPLNLEKNAEFIAAILRQRGIAAQLLQAEGCPPVVFAELKTNGAERTVSFYVHYDGQPVKPADWRSDPFSPVLLNKRLEDGGREVSSALIPGTEDGEWRLYARSAGDDKAPIVALLAALDALRFNKIRPAVNMKFFFEGEEEGGSPHLESILKKHAERLRADIWLLCDGPLHQSRRPIVYFGARGVCGLEMTVYGPLRHLHDGHYGNWAPNPALMLARLVAGMRDDEGNILIPGFYDDIRPLTEMDKQALAEVPAVEPELMQELGLVRSEGRGKSLVECIMLPALNIRGLASGGVGEQAANAIPIESRASIDFRLVPDQKPDKIRYLVEEFIRRQGYTIVDRTPDLARRLKYPRLVKLEWEPGYPAARVEMDLPIVRSIVQAAERGSGRKLIRMPFIGGSIPMYLFRDILRAPVLVFPIANHDNNQHGANENLRLQNLWDAVAMFAAILTDFSR